MTGLEVLEKIAKAKERYWKNNGGRTPDYLIISQNLYFRLHEYMTNGFLLKHFDEADYDKETTISGMKIKLIGDKDFLMVGCNEILGLKGE